MRLTLTESETDLINIFFSVASVQTENSFSRDEEALLKEITPHGIFLLLSFIHLTVPLVLSYSFLEGKSYVLKKLFWDR